MRDAKFFSANLQCARWRTSTVFTCNCTMEMIRIFVEISIVRAIENHRYLNANKVSQ